MVTELGKKEMLISSIFEENGFISVEPANYHNGIHTQYSKVVFNNEYISIRNRELQLCAGVSSQRIINFNLTAEGSKKTNLVFLFKLPKQEPSIRASFKVLMGFLPIYINLFNVTYLGWKRGLLYRNILESGKTHKYSSYEEDKYRFVIYCNINTIYCTDYVHYSYDFALSWRKKRNDFSLNFEYPEKSNFTFSNKTYNLSDLSEFMKDIALQ